MRMFKTRATSRGTGSAFFLFLVALGMVVFSARSIAVPPGMELTFEGGPKPVIFSGQVHADHGLKCKDCHPGLFKMEKGDAKIAFMDHLAGKKYCFACHNGTKAYAPKGNCNKCHGNKSPSAAPAERREGRGADKARACCSAEAEAQRPLLPRRRRKRSSR